MGLEDWDVGYHSDIKAFAAVRRRRMRGGRDRILIMTGEDGDQPESPDEYVTLGLYEWDDDKGEWIELRQEQFSSPMEAAETVETRPRLWGLR
jgi:hypothetical protein